MRATTQTEIFNLLHNETVTEYVAECKGENVEVETEYTNGYKTVTLVNKCTQLNIASQTVTLYKNGFELLHSVFLGSTTLH